MAIVIESTATSPFSASASVTITKPTGLAVDDLMVAILGSRHASVPILFTVPSGWTLSGDAQQPTGDIVTDVMYKLAEASDVSASNFTFTATGADDTAGMLMRVSGIRTDSPEDSADTALDTASDPTFSLSLTAGQNNVLYVVAYSVRSPTTADITLPVINGTNPTWVEQMDEKFGTIGSLTAFTAIVDTTAAITTLDQTISPGGSGWAVVFSIYGGINDVTGNVPIIEDNGSVFAVSGKVGVRGTVPLIEDNGSVGTVSGTVSQPTPWSTTTKS